MIDTEMLRENYYLNNILSVTYIFQNETLNGDIVEGERGGRKRVDRDREKETHYTKL